MSNAVTRVTLTAERDDPLETIRRAVALADAMIEDGAVVTITGDLSMTIALSKPEPEPDADE